MACDRVDGRQTQGAIRLIITGTVARKFDRMPAVEFTRLIAAAHAFLRISQPGVVKTGGTVPQRHYAEFGVASRTGVGFRDVYPFNRRQFNLLCYGFHQFQQLVFDGHYRLWPETMTVYAVPVSSPAAAKISSYSAAV